MAYIYTDKTPTRRVRRLQLQCSIVFVVMFFINLLGMVLKQTGVIPRSMSFYIPLTGLLSVIGYAMLYRLASNALGQIFACCQMVLMGFFFLMLTMAVKSSDIITSNHMIVLLICVIFASVSIYLWTVLLNNTRFRASERQWIIMLPIPFLMDICIYYTIFTRNVGDNDYLSTWSVDNPYLVGFSWLFTVVSAIGYWHLCNSSVFSGESGDLSYPSWTPFNRYTVAYAVAIAMILLVF